MEAVVYYVIALGLFMETSYGEVLRCLIEGLSWLEGQEPARAAGKSSPERSSNASLWSQRRKISRLSAPLNSDSG